MFKNRIDAALQLTERLMKYKNEKGVVLAIPKGGVPIGYIVSKALNMPMGLVMSKKIGHPVNKEFAIGSVGLHGVIINGDAQVTEEYLKKEIKSIRNQLKENYKKFLGGKRPVKLKNKMVIIVDDGAATGSTLLTTIKEVSKMDPKKIIAAIPVGSEDALARIKSSVDELVYLDSPKSFYSVSGSYKEFEQVTEEQVQKWLNKTKDENQLVHLK
ncbi:phosphoribosyltransferase family protein [Fulvivirgaceae bacterium BMA10]|uniref:Phosphoribosyltransferase family protein n=1 Tax=Splendidivirga corallicola TaxID=3051826 RepID=A0ABT8KT37_9BACT|nr:phosphoribosyltransferase family protein [Fulvivirgaceae bacterium BMA10]